MNSNRRTQIKSRRPKGAVAEKKPRIKKRNIAFKLGEIDFTFLFLIIVLLAFGLVMLLSASTPSANTKIGDSYYFFIRQLCGVGAGALGMVFFAMVDYHKYKKYINVFFLAGVILLICCRIPGIGQFRNGAWRWLRTPFIQLQPSEFMKPLIVLFFAKLVTEKKYRLDNVAGLGVYAAILVLIAGIMWLLQKHLSGAIVICAMGVVVLLVAGAKLKYFAMALIAVIPVGGILLLQDPTRWGRVLSFLDPFRDTGDKSYQITQSLIAIGTGGLFGKGLGQSVQKYGFLPEPYNDFIFAIVCEELGFIGAIIVIGLFVALVIRGIKIAMEAPDMYGALITVGIMSHIAIQSLFNVAVVSCSMPTTGMSLPFFSYGGTAIMVLVAEMGIVLNVSRQSTKTRVLPK